LIFVTSVTSFSSFSGLVSAVSAIYIEILEDLDTSSTVCSNSLKEVIEELVTHSIKFFSYYTIC